MEDSDEIRETLLNKDPVAYNLRYANRYLGPNRILMKFKNFNPRKEPRLEASQYEDCFADAGRREMERRFRERRRLFLKIYDRERPRTSLAEYMKAAGENEGYLYSHKAASGPASMFLGGSVSKDKSPGGALPECHLLGFVDSSERVGCMAHPLAETSRGYDGRDHAGFFHHTGCCRNVGCAAGKEYHLLSPSARKVFDRAVDGMSWYEYSRHATSVLVYYLRSYDHLFQILDEEGILDGQNLRQLAAFTNAIFDAWPLGSRGDKSPQDDSLDVHATDLPEAEKTLYVALDSRFLNRDFVVQLRKARNFILGRVRTQSRDASVC
jgi:hypothetical protein